IETPLMSLVPQLESTLKNAFQKFQKKHPDLVDCNAWFVDPDYSKKNSGMNLSDLGYFMVCMNLLRFGYDHFIGCTNETYHASRWLDPIGNLPRGLFFEHPVVKASHRLILMDQFNLAHFADIHKQYKNLIGEIYEVFPASAPAHQSLPEFVSEMFAEAITSVA
ncbi:MAG TPA: hypothetical protein VN132_04145, partial [Bdellovibrio sp.]|nr:hypothetical protein [Bdellovibrio sp.]